VLLSKVYHIALQARDCVSFVPNILIEFIILSFNSNLLANNCVSSVFHITQYLITLSNCKSVFLLVQ
jgi:hypothetical protein